MSLFYYRHQDVAKCLPGQSLRIRVADAARYLAQTYETDFEVCSIFQLNTSLIKEEISLSLEKVKLNCPFFQWGDDPVKDIIQKTNDAQRLTASDPSDAKKGILFT